MNNTALNQDARNRALRSFLQGLAIDVAVAVCLVLTTVLIDANGWDEIEWSLLGFSLAKTVAQTIAAFVMRRFLDKSRVPTPLPRRRSPSRTTTTRRARATWGCSRRRRATGNRCERSSSAETSTSLVCRAWVPSPTGVFSLTGRSLCVGAAPDPSTAVWCSFDDVHAVHGHNGTTRIVFHERR